MTKEEKELISFVSYKSIEVYRKIKKYIAESKKGKNNEIG